MAIRILFIDWAPFAYDAETPLNTPLGGAQSAAVYLAVALVERGHDVVFINQIDRDTESRGVLFTCLPKSTVWLNEFQVIVSVTGLRADTLRSIGCSVPVVAWCPHDVNQAAVDCLRDSAHHSLYAAFAMVSQWQLREYATAFGINPEKMHVLRNAISPRFESIERSWHWLESGRAPTLAYFSTPFRGLDVLLLAFPLIRRAIPDAKLRIHSGMQTYRRNEQDQLFNSLYEVARVMPGVDSTGPIGQKELAESIRRSDVLAYPCTFRETSCITVMEAAAAGLLIETTDLAALPETLDGFANLIAAATAVERENLSMFATRYAEAMVGAYEAAMSAPELTKQNLMAQMHHFQSQNTWGKRAIDWENILLSII
jgi:glycosyltransferase involved in cell wall biosynthesis